MRKIKISEKALEEFTIEVLQKLNVQKEDAGIIAKVLLCADRRGIHTHGVGKLVDYIKRVEAEIMDIHAPVVIENEYHSTAIVNANNNFGQVAASMAMDLAIKKAMEYGISFVLVKNSNHFGIASYYSLMAAEKNMIGISISNASPGIAPFGSKDKLLGTNPISVAIPSKDSFPIVLDMSSSVVARGKIRQAFAADQEIPLGWARDEDGVPTTDPEKALKGTLEPIAGPKGSAIALIVEILCGLLTNSSKIGNVTVVTDTSRPCSTSHLMSVIKPGVFLDEEKFLSDVDKTIEKVKALSPINGEIFLPGEIENNERLHQKEFIYINEDGFGKLKALSEKYEIKLSGEAND